jgi:hypothetical protein
MNNDIIVCDNKNCGSRVPSVESEVSANYCDFECAIEAEGWLTGIFLRIERERE